MRRRGGGHTAIASFGLRAAVLAEVLRLHMLCATFFFRGAGCSGRVSNTDAMLFHQRHIFLHLMYTHLYLIHIITLLPHS